MLKTEKGSTQISTFQYRFEEDVRILKEKSIRELLNQHPKVFRNIIEFDDWPSAMRYLMEHKAETLAFWERDNDQ